MAGPARPLTLAAALAGLLALPSVAPGQGFAGDYLAARQASIFGDFEAAARYYDRTIAQDGARPELLEKSVFAHMALGDFGRAGELGARMMEVGQAGRIAQMAVLVQRLEARDYVGAVAQIDDEKGAGGLVDGLVKAWSLLGEGDMSAALVTFDELAASDGLAPFASYHKALALASVGDFEGAAAIFASGSMGVVQGTRRAIMAHAEILSQLDRNDAAVDVIEEAFSSDLDPGVRALRQSLESGETVPFTHARSARAGLAETFYTLAGAFSSEMSNDFLLIYSNAAVTLDPQHVDAILLTAELYDQVGQHDLAVEAYRSVPREHPSYHAAELGRAASLRRSDRMDAAVEVLETLADTHGDLPVVMSSLGDLYREMERFGEAVEAYTAALETFESPSDAQWFLYYARGICEERQGNWDAAEADFRAALDLNPEQPQVLNYLGYSLVEQQEKLEEALEMIERAVALSPNSGYIVDSLGWALYRLGRYDEAVGHMERAAELMPIDPVVNDHLGDVYWAVGREREAEFMWNRALSFVDHENVSQDADPERIRRKIEIGLDQVLAEEGAPPLDVAADGGQ